MHRIELRCPRGYSRGLTGNSSWDEGREEHGPAEQRGRGEGPFPCGQGASPRRLKRSSRVVDGCEPAVPIVDVDDEASAAGTETHAKAGRCACRAHVRV